MAFSTIDKSSLFINSVLYTGNAGTQSITGVGFQPDLNWIKCRGAAENHNVSDSVRGDSGASSGYYVLNTNSTAISSSGSYNALVTALDSDGFSVGINDQVNIAQPFVAWNWKAGTTSGLSGGTITPSAYSINTTSGFGMYAYTGNSTAGATIAHGLGKKPALIICKRLNDTGGWSTYHQSLGATKFMYLDLSDGEDTGSTFWNDTEPTTSVFSLGTHGTVNNSAGTYMAYVWTEVPGYSKISSYTGNNNTDGPFIFTGFEVSWVLIKKTNASGNYWTIWDKARTDDSGNYGNPAGKILHPNVNNAENAGSVDEIDFLSNGFKVRNTVTGINGSGDTMIYMAFGQPIISNSGICATAR